MFYPEMFVNKYAMMKKSCSVQIRNKYILKFLGSGLGKVTLDLS
jgi:hypothetical protein